MKTIAMIVLSAFAISMVSCEKGDPLIPPETNNTGVVTNVYNYDGDLLAHYEYNDNDQLIKRSYTDPVNNRSSDMIFHYENNLVSIVSFVDHDSPQFSYEKHYFYNDDGKVDKFENHQGGQLLSTAHINYSDQGLVESFNTPGNEPTTFFTYDSSGNVVKTTNHLRDYYGQESIQEIEFEYDTKKKASSGLEYLVGVEFLPHRGNTSIWEQSLSQNNLLSEKHEGTESTGYIIEYDQDNYPKTITMKWKDIETETPMTIRIEYESD